MSALIQAWVVEPGMHLHGRVYGSHRFGDGQTITTSPVLKVLRPKGRRPVAVTRTGSHYRLGTPLNERRDRLVAAIEDLIHWGTVAREHAQGGRDAR